MTKLSDILFEPRKVEVTDELIEKINKRLDNDEEFLSRWKKKLKSETR